MLQLNKRRCVIILLLILFFINDESTAAEDSSQITDFVQIIGFPEKISPTQKHGIFINESEFYKDKKRTYEVGLPSNSFIPQPRKSQDSINYFNSLNLTEDYIYVIMQFETLDGDPKREQMDLLATDNITLFEYHGDHTYYAKIPRTILETKSYDFVRWVGVVQDPAQKMSAELNNYIKTTQNSNVNISIVFFEKPSTAQIDFVKKNSNQIISEGGNYLDINIDIGKIYIIASLNFIKKIEKIFKYKIALDRSVRVVATDYVWDFPNDGSGITVGILDTGIQRSHPHFDFRTIFNSSDYANGGGPEAVCGESNCSDNSNNDNDWVGPNPKIDEGTHGVHVAGIISGQSTYNNRLIKGISHDANLVIERVFNEENVWVAPDARFDDIWKNILDPDNDSNYFEVSSADIISNSWGANVSGEYTESSKEVDRVVKGELGRPAVVVFAAGNDHPTFGVNSPGTAKNVITVGASADFFNSTKCRIRYLDTNGDEIIDAYIKSCYNSSALNVMDYSSRKTKDGRVKPDILAPQAQP